MLCGCRLCSFIIWRDKGGMTSARRFTSWFLIFIERSFSSPSPSLVLFCISAQIKVDCIQLLAVTAKYL